MAANDIGIDLGTASSLVYHAARGMVFKEPSVVVYDRMAERLRYIGEEALSMTDHLVGNMELIWPIRQGVIYDYIVLEKLVRYFISRAMGAHAFRKPRITLCLPQSITEIGRRALTEAAYQAGARKVYLVDAPTAAAIGMGLDVLRPSGNMVVDIGAGTINAAVISMAGVVVSSSVKVGSQSFNKAIMSHMRQEHNLYIGEEQAEKIKVNLGCAVQEPRLRTMDITGRNVTTGLPKVVTLTSLEVNQALHEILGQIVDVIHSILEKTPPELAADIVDRGILLTGGGALLSGLDTLVEQKTEVSCMTANDPVSATVIGTAKYPQILAMMERD